MLSYLKGRESLVIIIHEIYGLNKHMEYISSLIDSFGHDVICPNLFPVGKTFEDHQEIEAYTYFMESIGWEKGEAAIMSLNKQYRGNYDRIFLMGFSVGATIAWLCSNKESIDGVVCYYGSRIRDFLSIEPTCPTFLFFANNEKSFIVQDLVDVLKNKRNKNIQAHVYNANHGFANPFSTNFCKDSFEATLSR